jgi:hypothetical protein
VILAAHAAQLIEVDARSGDPQHIRAFDCAPDAPFANHAQRAGVDEPGDVSVVSLRARERTAMSGLFTSRNDRGRAADARESDHRPLIIVVVGIVVGTVVARLRGYRLGGNVVVRCRNGHLFTTIWVPGASLKSIRLGWWRLQRCPVGKHWSLVTPVKEAELTEEEQRIASEHKDMRVP